MNAPCPSALVRVRISAQRWKWKERFACSGPRYLKYGEKSKQDVGFFPSQLTKMENIGPHRKFLS